MATTPGGASRGGFSWTLTTKNLMANPPERQPSLSQCLAGGVYGAHRNSQSGIVDARNFRRSIPLQQATKQQRRMPRAQGSSLSVEQELMRRRAGR